MTNIQFHQRAETVRAIATLTADCRSNAGVPGLDFLEDQTPVAFAYFEHRPLDDGGNEFAFGAEVRDAANPARFIRNVKRHFLPEARLLTWDADSFDFPLLAFEAMAAREFAGKHLPDAQRAISPHHKRHHALREELFAGRGCWPENIGPVLTRLGIPTAPIGEMALRGLYLAGDEAKLRALAERRALELYVLWLHWHAYVLADVAEFVAPLVALQNWVVDQPPEPEKAELFDWIGAIDLRAFMRTSMPVIGPTRSEPNM